MEDGDVIDAHLQQARTHHSSGRLLSFPHARMFSLAAAFAPAHDLFAIDLEHLIRPIFVVFDHLLCCSHHHLI